VARRDRHQSLLALQTRAPAGVAGGIAFALVAGTGAVIAPWYLLVRPGPFLAPGRDPWIALAAGLGAACLNGIGMIFLPALLDAPPAVVGTRMLILNVTVVGVVAVWSVGFRGQSLTPSKIAGVLLAIAAVWLLGR
jgi:drug/metabolite transporter (DMT)-like permease